MTQMNFFQKLLKHTTLEDQNEIIESMCMKLRIEKYPTGSLVIQEGDESNENMYLVAYGQCTACISDSKGIDEVNLKVNRKLKNLYEKFGKPVQVISQGEAFGEVNSPPTNFPIPSWRSSLPLPKKQNEWQL